MANNIGLWINYNTGQIEEIDDHERWIRRGNNARKFGVPDDVISDFKDFVPAEDREKFLLFILDKSSLMRCRSHGNYVTFEFSSRRIEKPIAAIRKASEVIGLGMYSGMFISNLATGEQVSTNYLTFKRHSQWADKVIQLSERVEMKKLYPTLAESLQATPIDGDDPLIKSLLNG